MANNSKLTSKYKCGQGWLGANRGEDSVGQGMWVSVPNNYFKKKLCVRSQENQSALQQMDDNDKYIYTHKYSCMERE